MKTKREKWPAVIGFRITEADREKLDQILPLETTRSGFLRETILNMLYTKTQKIN